MPSVLLQKLPHAPLRAFLVISTQPWRLGPFDARECEAFGDLLCDETLCRTLGNMLRQHYPPLAMLLLRWASDETQRMRLADEFYAAADTLYSLEEPDSETEAEAEELPTPSIRIAE